MNVFDFQIRGYKVDEYCFAIIDKYGEKSDIAKTLDREYSKLVEKSPVYVEQLNTIRQFLCNEGYEREVEEQDKVFLENITKENISSKPSSILKRWE